MKTLTWRGIECLIVPPLVTNRCQGCIFDHTIDSECPHTDSGIDINCTWDNDLILIENTPEALAEYTAKRLGGGS